MGDECCANCQFFKRTMLQANGLCVSRPPHVLLVGMREGQNGEPVPVVNSYCPSVPDTHWCGDWREGARRPVGVKESIATMTAEGAA